MIDISGTIGEGNPFLINIHPYPRIEGYRFFNSSKITQRSIDRLSFDKYQLLRNGPPKKH